MHAPPPRVGISASHMHLAVAGGRGVGRGVVPLWDVTFALVSAADEERESGELGRLPNEEGSGFLFQWT